MTQSSVDALDSKLAQTFGGSRPGAACLVARGDDVLLRKGYGLANVELSVPVEPETVFRIGSLTKQFTAVGILLLQEQGKLSLEDVLSRYLPGYPEGDQITLSHLLSHTSGVKSFTELESFGSQMTRDLSPDALIDLFKNEPLNFSPGEELSYSNSGYVLLGRIIEIVSSKPYAQFLQEAIFDPLGMNRTLYENPGEIVEKRAAGYESDNGRISNSGYISMTQAYAAGGLLSRVDDLMVWNRALTNNALISKESFASAKQTFTLRDGRASSHGFGWRVSDYKGHQLAEHSGGIPGFTCHMLRSETDDVVIALLTNGFPALDDPTDLVFEMFCELVEDPYDSPPAIPHAGLDKFAGKYQLGPQTINVSTAENRLLVQPLMSEAQSFYPTSVTEFALEERPFHRLFFQTTASEQLLFLHPRGELPLAAKRLA